MPEKSIAFEIPIDDIPKIASSPLKLSQTKRLNLSSDDLREKLTLASERKKLIDSKKSLKAAEEVLKAKEQSFKAKLEKQSSVEVTKSEIVNKLENAERRRLKFEEDKLHKLHNHNKIVEVISSSPLKDAPTEQEISSRLDAAEKRRNAVIEKKLNKLTEHHKTVEEIATSTLKKNEAEKVLNEKLELANQRRKLKEEEERLRLLKLNEHAVVVRKRKSGSITPLEMHPDEKSNSPPHETNEITVFEKLEAAEKRRNDIFKNKLDKLASHHKSVEMISHSPSKCAEETYLKVNKKLCEAERRRKLMVFEEKERLNRQEQHGKIVRLRKRQTIGMGLGQENLNQGIC